MRGKGKSIPYSFVLAAIVVAAPAGVHAQSLQDWSLPAPDPTPTGPGVQGPVDPQNPIVQPTDAPPSPAPSSTAPAPRVTPSAAPAARPTASPTPQSPSATPTAPATQRSAPAEPAPAPQPTPSASPSNAAAPVPTTEPSQPAERLPEPETVPAAPNEDNAPAWWWAIPLILLALVAGFLVLRRRKAAAPAENLPLAETAEPDSPAPEIPTAPVPTPKPAPQPAPPAAPAIAASRASGQIDFQPAVLRLSLFYATLQFHLRLTANTEFPSGKLLADMISAHGSLSQEVQLSPHPDAMQVVGQFSQLAPGQIFDIKGELQLPLNAIRAVHQGNAQVMVPLVRLALLGDNKPGLPHLELGCVFTIGLPGSGPALSPLRVDTGPRDFTGLIAREIESARRTSLLGLDHARAAS